MHAAYTESATAVERQVQMGHAVSAPAIPLETYGLALLFLAAVIVVWRALRRDRHRARSRAVPPQPLRAASNAAPAVAEAAPGDGRPLVAWQALDAMVIDTETTGLGPHERIVSLAAVRLVPGDSQRHCYYLIFDPRRDNQPEAAKLHGWDDWTLRFQDLFADVADELRGKLSAAKLLVAHNAEFDMSFLNRELEHAGLPPLDMPVFCTMKQARICWPGASASLDACLARIGLARLGRVHSAIEDAWLTADLLQYYHGREVAAPLSEQLADPLLRPSNFHEPPPRPEGALPHRSPKRRAKSAPAHARPATGVAEER